jgi:hypothetical protein
MKHLRIIRTPDGFAVCPECGGILNDERSLKHHRAFFGFNAHVFKHWPENAAHEGDPFQPTDEEHLRAWLLTRAKHQQPRHVFPLSSKREAATIMNFLNFEMAADRARGVYGWPTIAEGGLTIIRPASIAWDKCSQRKFNEVCRNVFQVVYDVTGIDFDAWKENRHDTDMKRAA